MCHVSRWPQPGLLMPPPTSADPDGPGEGRAGSAAAAPEQAGAGGGHDGPEQLSSDGAQQELSKRARGAACVQQPELGGPQGQPRPTVPSACALGRLRSPAFSWPSPPLPSPAVSQLLVWVSWGLPCLPCPELLIAGLGSPGAAGAFLGATEDLGVRLELLGGAAGPAGPGQGAGRGQPSPASWAVSEAQGPAKGSQSRSGAAPPRSLLHHHYHRPIHRVLSAAGPECHADLAQREAPAPSCGGAARRFCLQVPSDFQKDLVIPFLSSGLCLWEPLGPGAPGQECTFPLFIPLLRLLPAPPWAELSTLEVAGQPGHSPPALSVALLSASPSSSFRSSISATAGLLSSGTSGGLLLVF